MAEVDDILGHSPLTGGSSRLGQASRMLWDHAPRPTNDQKLVRMTRFRYVLIMVLRPGPTIEIWDLRPTRLASLKLILLEWTTSSLTDADETPAACNG